MSSCWTLAIEEGTLENVACPSFACVKKRAAQTIAEVVEPDRDFVAEVVGTQLRDRWEDLKAKRRAEIGTYGVLQAYCIVLMRRSDLHHLPSFGMSSSRASPSTAHYRGFAGPG